MVELHYRCTPTSCPSIGRCHERFWAIFWYFLLTHFVKKVAQIYHLFLGYFEKYHFLIKTVVASFWHLFE